VNFKAKYIIHKFRDSIFSGMKKLRLKNCRYVGPTIRDFGAFVAARKERLHVETMRDAYIEQGITFAPFSQS
jgi:hypothetical protein